MDPQKGGVSQAVRNVICDNKFAHHTVACFDNINIDYAIKDNFRIIKLGKGKTPFQYHPNFVKWLQNNICNYNYITVHGIWQYHNYAVYKAFTFLKRKTKKAKFKLPKLTIMPHGMLDPYFQNDKTRKFKAFRNRILWFCTEKKAINSADALLFTCEEELKLARTTFVGYKPQKELNVSLGVSQPPDFQYSMKSSFREIVPQNEPYWLFLSRIHPKKGIDLLIEAYKRLNVENKNIPNLVIAGPLDKYAIKMKNLAADCPKIIFTGMLMGNAKWGAFYGCESFILPSHQENFGIAVVEALACSKPVLISNKVNIWREIEQGNGGLVNNDNLEGITNLLEVWIDLDSQAKEDKYYSAKKIYNSIFTIEKAAEKYVKKIKNID